MCAKENLFLFYRWGFKRKLLISISLRPLPCNLVLNAKPSIYVTDSHAMGPHRRLKYPQRKYLRMTLPTADLVEILPPAKTRFCALSHSEMGCVKPQKCSSNGTSSICTMETIKANPAFLDCGARHSQYRPAPAALCQWVKYSKTITRLIFLPAAAPGQVIPAALRCLVLACVLAGQLVANTHSELDSGTDPSQGHQPECLERDYF